MLYSIVMGRISSNETQKIYRACDGIAKIGGLGVCGKNLTRLKGFTSG